MIRRTFWLGAGAAAGILGYRRVSAVSRHVLGGRRSGTAPGPRKQPRHPLRGTLRFARDVREGMDIYSSRHALPSGSTTARSAQKSLDRKDGR
jgi:hypothetical protein